MFTIIIWVVVGYLNLALSKEIKKSDYFIIWAALMVSLLLSLK